MVDGNVKNKDMKKRIAISISPELHSILADISELSGSPLSKFPAHVLEESLPTFKALRDAFQVADKDKSKAMSIVGENLEKALVSAASGLIR